MAIPTLQPPLQQRAQALGQPKQDHLAKSLRTFEDLLGDWTPERKAEAIKQQYGLVVDPKALRRGNVWWRKPPR